MKVLTMYHTNYGGGAYKKYEELIEYLKEDHQIFHISPKGFKSGENLSHCPTIPSPRNYFNFLIFFPQALFYSFALSQKINYVILNGLSYGVIGVIMKLINRKIKIVILIHGDYQIELEFKKIKFRSIFSQISNKIERIVFKNSDKILFVTKDLKVRALKRCSLKDNEKKFYVLYNNIEEKKLRKKVLLENTVGYIGRLDKIKNIDMLIRSILYVKKEIPQIRLIIVGDGPEYKNLVELTEKLDLKKNVSFTGYKTNVYDYYKKFDLFVLPSLYEGCPLSILEALSMNLPVLGAKVGGIKEILFYKDLLFENEKSLAEKIIEFFNNEEFRKKIIELCTDRKKFFIFDWYKEFKNMVIE